MGFCAWLRFIAYDCHVYVVLVECADFCVQIALPVSFGTGFGLHWKLFGLWLGPAIGLFVQSITEGLFIYKTSWKKASEEAAQRNALG